MSIEAVWAFREQSKSNRSLLIEISEGINNHPEDELAGVGIVARRNGFDLTDEELQQGWGKVFGGELTGELTDLELQLVSAGAGSPGICKGPTSVYGT